MIKFKIKAWLIVGLCAGLVGCSSSGSSDSTSGVIYAGSTVPATITSTNVDSLASTIASGSSGGAALASTGAIKVSGGLNFIALAESVVAQSAVAKESSGSSIAVGAMQAFNQTVNGVDVGGSGTMTIVGSVDSITGYGSLTMTMSQFNDGFSTMNGVITIDMSAVGMSMAFSNVSIVDATGSYTMAGSIVVATTAASETVTMNYAASDSTGFQVKLENFVMTTTYDAIGAITSESMAGRVYDSTQGYLDISTTSPMVYSPAGALNPSSGGPVVATGANGTKVRVTPIDSLNALIEADTTGDGNFDYSKQVAWSAL